jgi:membrane protein
MLQSMAGMLYTPLMKSNRHLIQRAWRSFVAAGRMMLKHKVPRDAAGISYFGLVALFPAVIVLIALVDAFLGWMNLHNIVLLRIIDLFPGSRQFLKSSLSQLTSPSTAIVISCIVVVLWSASWIYTFIESAINRAWGVSHQRTFWESRFRSIALMALGGFSLLCSAVLTTFVSTARALAEQNLNHSASTDYFMSWLWYLILMGTGFVIAVLVFAFIFKWTPHRKVLWMEALPGALVSTTLWEIGSFIFAKIVPYFDYQKIYGTLSAVIALLVWVYTSNLILIFGANFCAQLHWTRMDYPVPDAGAVAGQKLPRFRSDLR